MEDALLINEPLLKHPVERRFMVISTTIEDFLPTDEERARLSAVVEDFDLRKLPSDERLLPSKPGVRYITTCNNGNDNDDCQYLIFSQI